MSVYIYLFQDRIIHWSPQTMFSKPASVPHVTWYSVTGSIPMPLNDMVARGNVGYTLQKGFYTVETPTPPDWDERGNYVKQIQIMGSFNGIANTQKARYTDNSLGQSLTDILIIDEIRQYQQKKTLEDCPILTSMLETTEAGLTPDALVTKLWLRYESFRTIISYLNRLEHNVRTLFASKSFDEASELVNNEIEKMRV